MPVASSHKMASTKQNLWEWSDIAQKYRRWDPDHERWIYDDENSDSTIDTHAFDQPTPQRISLQDLKAQASVSRESLTSQQRSQQARQASNRMAQANYRRRLLREKEELESSRTEAEEDYDRKQRSQQTRQSMNAFSALAALEDENRRIALPLVQKTEADSTGHSDERESETNLRRPDDAL